MITNKGVSTIVLGFTGEYQDTVTTAYPLGQGYRWYLPHLMRFNLSDSLSPFGRGGTNPYVYCQADPINHMDPSGHMDEAVIKSLEEDLREMGIDVRSSLSQQEDQSIAAAETTRGSASGAGQAGNELDRARREMPRYGLMSRSHLDYLSLDVPLPPPPRSRTLSFDQETADLANKRLKSIETDFKGVKKKWLLLQKMSTREDNRKLDTAADSVNRYYQTYYKRVQQGLDVWSSRYIDRSSGLPSATVASAYEYNFEKRYNTLKARMARFEKDMAPAIDLFLLPRDWVDPDAGGPPPFPE